jgi:hypothetical protein
MFIFNTQLLLIGINSVFELLLTIFGAIVAMLTFGAATQGFWFTKSRLWESLALCLVAFILFRPGFFWDELYPKFEQKPASRIEQIAENLPQETDLRIFVEGETLEGKPIAKTVLLPLGKKGTGKERIGASGMELSIDGESVTIDMVEFGSIAQKKGLDFDWKVRYVEVLADRPPKHLMFIPGLLLLWGLAMIQKRRKAKLEAAATT